jgi:hypothetical protein
MKADVLHGNEKFPERRNFWIFPPGRQQEVNRQDNEVGGHDPQGATGKETPQVDALTASERREQLAADEVTAEHEEKIDTYPAETVHATGERKTHDTCVVDDHHDNGECAEKIEPRLALTIGKARVDYGLTQRFFNARNGAGSSSRRAGC